MTLREKVQEILDRAEKAPSGPWKIVEDAANGKDEAWCYWHRVGPLDLPGKTADAASVFVAAAREDVPWLCRKLLLAEEALLEIERGGYSGASYKAMLARNALEGER